MPLWKDESKAIPVLAYPLENVFAEKLDTIVSRGAANTRTRDFYDVYMLYVLKKDEINFKTLRIALEATSRRRNTFKTLEGYPQILESIGENKLLKLTCAKKAQVRMEGR